MSDKFVGQATSPTVLLKKLVTATQNITGGGGGGGVWGSITGTLSSQTDLQTALNAKLAASIAAYSTFANNTSGTAAATAVQSLTLGTPGFVDTGIDFQWTSTVAGYTQGLIQNLSNAVNASADFVVNNDLGSATTNYGNFGINSSTFTGAGSFNLPNATYLSATTGDLVLGHYNQQHHQVCR